MKTLRVTDAAPRATSSPDHLPADVRERALVASSRAFTVADARKPGLPLIWVNSAFENLTGFTLEQIRGRNCRFLQGPDTDPAALRVISDALRGGHDVEVTLLNYRADGSSFWNELSISPVLDDAGVQTHFVGVQSDVTNRVVAERSSAMHLAQERVAAREREQVRRHLAVLVEATSLLASTLDFEQTIERLSDLVVPELADWCFVDLFLTNGSGRRSVVRHRDPEATPLLQRLRDDVRAPALGSPIFGEAGPMLLEAIPASVLREAASSDDVHELLLRLGASSAMVVPLAGRSESLGSITFVRGADAVPYTGAELMVATDLGRRAGLTLDNARFYTREHEVAAALQYGLLPEVLPVPGVTTATRYLPGTETAQIGGDWYDVFALPDGAVGMAIGDVMGHDLAAAAAMGQLRSVLRSYAWRGTSPAEVLDSLDELVQGLSMAQLATTVYARLELLELERPARRLGDTSAGPGSDRRRLDVPILRYANAGHLPPLLRTPDRKVRALEDGRSVLIGAPPGGRRTEAAEAVPPGSVLLFYTDGLVERRRASIDVGIGLLAKALADAPDDAEALCDHVLAALYGIDHDDDVAILAVVIEPVAGVTPAAPAPRSATPRLP